MTSIPPLPQGLTPLEAVNAGYTYYYASAESTVRDGFRQLLAERTAFIQGLLAEIHKDPENFKQVKLKQLRKQAKGKRGLS